MSLISDKIVSQIKSEGYSCVENAIKESEINKKLSFLNNDNTKARGNYPVFFNQYLIKLLKFDFNKLKQTNILNNIAKNLNLKEISDKFFNSESEMYMIDTYHSEKAEKDIIPWHNDIGLSNNDELKKRNVNQDQANKSFYASSIATINNYYTGKSARGLKFFIYLTDVEKNNGSLAIIPSSNKIVHALTSLILERKIKLSPYWNLNNLRNLILNLEINKLLKNKLGAALVDNFIQKTSFITSSEKNTVDFDLPMKAGSMIIFDELCVHRGGPPKKNSRRVLRYIFRKKIN